MGIDPALQLLLFVGRIEPLKGIETLFQAVARLRDLGVCECNQMAVAVIGGLITSTMLSLVLVPVVYEFVDDFEQWLKPRLARLITPREVGLKPTPEDRL